MENTFIKCVIYGCGFRGKKFADYFGYENVLAFIDEDQNLWGKNYKGIPIISLEDYKRNYTNIIVFISVYKQNKHLADKLEKEGIFSYLDIEDIPYQQWRAGNNLEINLENERKYVIYGLTWMSIYIKGLIEKYNDNKVDIIVNKMEYNIHTKTVSNIYKVELQTLEIYQAKKNSEIIIIKQDAYIERYISEFPQYRYITLLDLFINSKKLKNDKVKKYKKIHDGEKCFIVATGPSLTAQDLDKLQSSGIRSFGVNMCYNIFDRTKWRPDYYVAIDNIILDNYGEEIASVNSLQTFVSNFYNGDNDNVIKLNLHNVSRNGMKQEFIYDISNGIIEGGTVVYAAIQIAVYMGFSEIYLIGVDTNYTQNIRDENNHFMGYYNKDVMVTSPDVMDMLKAYQCVEKLSYFSGFRVYNATRGGMLEVFERVDFDKVIEENLIVNKNK